MKLTRFPLCWPDGWKRTAESDRKNAHFWRASRGDSGVYMKRSLTVTDGVERILDELRHLGIDADDSVISTNVPVRMDGLPMGKATEPRDPGVAVYWQRGGRQQSIATDVYKRVADNLGAIGASLEALRTIARHGGPQILDRAFRGFAQLPERSGGPLNWRAVLEFSSSEYEELSRDQIEERFRELSHRHHPDKGGTDQHQADLNRARSEALSEIGR